MRAAQDDVQRARAALSVSKDIFIPSVTSAGGVGYSYGITLSVPTIFTVNAQSLVYSSAQRFYIRGAQADLNAAVLALADAREQVEEDAAITYISLSHAQDSIGILTEEYSFSENLLAILQDRMKVGLVSELDVKRSRRALLQMKLDRQHAEDELAALDEHLSVLTGLDTNGLVALTDSIPPPPSTDTLITMLGVPHTDTFAILSAEANLIAKEDRAAAGSRYLYRPQVSFSADYGRVSPVNNVSQYYNLNGHYNVAVIAVQIQFPLFDRVRNAASRESFADVQGSSNRLQLLRDDQKEARLKLRRSTYEFATELELAELDEGIAQDELKDIQIQLKALSGGRRAMTPEDEQNAKIRERQKYRELLDTRFEALRRGITILRQSGQLGTWVQPLVQASPLLVGPDRPAKR